jgi:hypothetical protein
MSPNRPTEPRSLGQLAIVDQMSSLLLCVFFLFLFFPHIYIQVLVLLVDQFSELGVFWLLPVTTSHTTHPGKTVVWFFYLSLSSLPHHNLPYYSLRVKKM